MSGTPSPAAVRVAVLCMHTSPLAQPGMGDGGGMNVYVKELSTSLARAGVICDVYTRADEPGPRDGGANGRNSAISTNAGPVGTIAVEPGFRVHKIAAGPLAPVAKEDLASLVPQFTAAVRTHLLANGGPPDVIHANYWLSAAAGHALKHELRVPLVSTFHTLARVKEAGADPEPESRARAEAEVIGCSDVILASCWVERDELVTLYDAEPLRIEEVPLGVDHAFFSPGSRCGARRALALPCDVPVLLFVGRIQPLKGVDVAIRALARTSRQDALLVVVGGPSGREGPAEWTRVQRLVADLGVAERVRFVDPQPHHLLSTYYRAADVCLVPSRSESFGLVALEAGACGTPVVAAGVGGLRTLIDDGRTGFLIPERDPVAYAMAIDRILDNPETAAVMGIAAAERSQRYAWSYTAARLRRLYADLAVRTLVACG